MSDNRTVQEDIQQLTSDGDRFSEMLRSMQEQSAAVQKQLDSMRAKGDSISVPDMFEMQMLMNKLSQMSEMSTGILSASNAAIASMARNIKG
jgi:exo-beta-1,3-glucanase (GH17 family)